MNWQVNIYCWGRSIATQENLDPGEKRINRIYYIHAGEAYLELDGGKQRLIPGWLYVLPESMRINSCFSVIPCAQASVSRRKSGVCFWQC